MSKYQLRLGDEVVVEFDQRRDLMKELKRLSAEGFINKYNVKVQSNFDYLTYTATAPDFYTRYRSA